MILQPLEERLNHLSPARLALLRRRLVQKSLTEVRDQQIPRRATSRPCIASFSQQQLWFLDQLSPATSTYNVPYAMRILGELDVDALTQAFEAVVGRHQVLRTVFADMLGKPVQVVLRTWPGVLRTVDLRGQSPERQQAEALRLIEEDARRPFQLARDLMLRGLIVRLNDRESILLHVSHHIGWDYRSRVILYQELAHCYAAFAAGRRPTLPELPIQYADFALWQRHRLRGKALEELTTYWKSELRDVPTQLCLPTDRKRPQVQSQRGAKYFFDLPVRLVESARSLSVNEGVTLYMALLAAFQAFLFNLTGQGDFCIGSPVAGRNQVQTEDLIGFFINTVVLRGRMSAELTFRELLKRMRKTVLGVHTHQELPFERLVDIVRPPRNLGHNPLFQVNFRVASAEAPILELPGLIVSPLDLIDTATSKFDLAMELTTLPNIRSYCEYNTDIFSQATIAGFCDQFLAILDTLLKGPEIRLGDLGSRRSIGASTSGRPHPIAGLGSLRRTGTDGTRALIASSRRRGE